MGFLERLRRRQQPELQTPFQAVWKNIVLAESSNTISVDGKRYFPPEDVKWEFFRLSDKQTVCPWKGVAGYYDIEAEGRHNRAAAWVYPEPQPAAAQLKDHVAFWKGVKVRPARDT